MKQSNCGQDYSYILSNFQEYYPPYLPTFIAYPRAPGLQKMRLTFCPPKPKELDIAQSTAHGRAILGMQSKGMAGSSSSRCAVGGNIPVSKDRIVATASNAPAAPIVWPIRDFVELTNTPPTPKTCSSATASARSFCTVPVPWGLT